MGRLVGLLVLLLHVGVLSAQPSDLIAVELVPLGKYQIVVEYTRDDWPDDEALRSPPVFESKRMRLWHATDGAQFLSLVLWIANTSDAEINGAKVELSAIGKLVPLGEACQAEQFSLKDMGTIETLAIESIAAGEVQVVRFTDLTMADLYGGYLENGLWPEDVIFEVVFTCPECSSEGTEGTSTTVHLIRGD